jgi:hypothetical protein
MKALLNVKGITFYHQNLRPRHLPPRPHEVSKLANLSGPRWDNLTQPFPTYGVSALDHPKADTLIGPAHDPSTQVTPVLKMVNLTSVQTFCVPEGARQIDVEARCTVDNLCTLLFFLNGSSVLPYMTRSPPGLGTHLGQVYIFRG